MKIILLLGLSGLSGLFYAISGKGGFSGAKLIRRLRFPLCLLLTFWGLAGFKLSHIWLYLATFGLNVGAMSAYWSEFQNPKTDDILCLDCNSHLGYFFDIPEFIDRKYE